LDDDFGAVPADDAVDHCQAKAGAALTLGGEERLQAALLRLFVHADARVSHFEPHAAGRGVVFAERGGVAGGHLDGAALGHGVHRVEDEIGQRVADLVLRAADVRQARPELRLQLDHHAASLRQVVPARAREGRHLLDQRVNLDVLEVRLLLARAIELAHAGHSLRHVVDGSLDGHQAVPRARGQVGLALQQ
jgi:hypothetical protein